MTIETEFERFKLLLPQSIGIDIFFELSNSFKIFFGIPLDSEPNIKQSFLK